MSTSTQTATILVAEDDPALREVLVLALEASGFNAVAVGTANDALACLRARTVDLLLLDLRLGTDSGIDLLKSARQLRDYRDLPVVLLTGCADRRTVLAIAQLGVQGYLLKNQFSRKDLMSRINRLLAAGDSSLLGSSGVPTPQTALASKMPKPGSEPTPEPHHARDDTVLTAASLSIGPTKAEGDEKAEIEAPDESKPVASPAELLGSVKPIITRAQTLEQADKCIELKAFSPTVAQLMSMTAESNCSLEQIARVIKRDQAIALKVLKIANSVVYSRGGTVETVQQALSRIGVSQIRQVVLNIAVIDNFPVAGLGEQFNCELFWEHSIATGLIAAAITRFRQADERAIDSAFTMGLLHDVARMVFVEQLGEIYKRVLDTAERLQLPLEHVEARMLLINHADLMDRLLVGWKFPKHLVEPIAMHHLSVASITTLTPQKVAEVSTLALANRLAHSLLLGSSGNNCQYPTDEFVRILELKPDAITFIEDKIPEQTADMKFAMLQSGNGQQCQDLRQNVLKKFHLPVRSLYVSANPKTDGYGMLFERLGQIAGNRQPNVAVLHLANIRERESLFRDLQERENVAGVERLPLVVVSPLTNLKLEQSLLAGRVHRVMPSPFTLSGLANTVNSLVPH